MLTEIPETQQTIVKTQTFWKIFFVFFLGALCFLFTQILTRVPLLGWLQKQPRAMLWAMSYPLLSGVIIAMTAGIFEESGRFAFKALALKPARSPFWEPVVFGLGHGLCEVVWMILSVWGTVSILGPNQLILPLIERLLAVIMHVGFSVIIWNGFQLDRRLRYLLLAILAHGLVDAMIPVAGMLGWGVLQMEGLFAGFASLLLIYSVYSRKYYRKETSHE